MTSLARHRLFALVPALAVVLSAVPAAQPAAVVPHPREVLGFTPGDDYKLADFTQMRDYFRRLDEASDRVRVYSAGESTEGREMLVAVISSDANMARLERYRQIARRLALARGVSPDEARDLAREGRAVVWIDNGLHASEVATAQHAFLLAHRVATEESAEMREIRDNVILVLLPTVNPDGLDMVVDWYRKTLGTPHQDSSMPWLYQKYVGHDNNRDAYMQTQAETRVINRLLYDEWLPQIMYNQHQGTWPPRIFVPPFPDPFNPNIDPQVMRGIDLVGGAMLNRFEREGKDGVITRYQFSTWYNGSIRTTSYFHNMIGILTETGHASATPFTYDPDDFPAVLDNGVPTLEPTTTYPNPWRGGTLRLADAVDYMLTGSLAVLEVAAKYRESFLHGIWQVGARQIEKGRTEAPVAYVIPPAQHDPPVAAAFVETLMRGAVEVHRADAAFTADGRSFPAGSWVVSMAQPFRPFAKDLLEPQRYPDLRASPGGPPIPPYDTAGWTLSYQMGVEAVAIERPFDARLTPLEAFPRIEGRVAGDAVKAAAYELPAALNASHVAANRLLAAGLPVSRLAAGSGGRTPGAFIVRVGSEGERSRVATVVRDLGVTAAAVAAPAGDAVPLAPARIGLYRSWVANMDEGWTRWLLEQYEFPFDTLRDADLRAGRLRDRFDVVILPHQAAASIVNGHQGERARVGRPAPWSPVPPEYRGGIGDEGVAALKAFVQAGGTLIAFDAASELPITRFGGVFARIRNPLGGFTRSEFYCPGSVLRLDIDAGHPIGWGMPSSPAAYFAGSRAFETDDPAVKSVARYADEERLLMSGWLLGARHLAGRHAVLEVPFGAGRVLLYGFRPQFRAQPHGTFKLWFNALHAEKQR